MRERSNDEQGSASEKSGVTPTPPLREWSTDEAVSASEKSGVTPLRASWQGPA